MFKEWLEEHDLKEVLRDAACCYDSPSAEDRMAWKGIDEGYGQEAVRSAEKWQQHDWGVLTATAFMDFVRNGDRMRYERAHFERRFALGDLIAGECVEGKGRFLDDIIDLIWMICEESFWGVPAHNWSPGYQGEALPNVENPYVDLFAAETASLLAWARYLLGSRLDRETHIIVRRIDIELQRRIIKPFLEHEDYFWMGFDERDVVNNWNAWIISNLTGVFLMTDYDSFERVRGLKKLLLCLDRFVAVYPEDGGCDEGTSYWMSAGGALFDTLDQLRQATNGAMDFSGNKKVQEIGRFLYRTHISRRYFVNFADGAAQINIPREMVYRFGKYIGDEKMMGLSAAIESKPEEVDIPQPLRRKIPALFIGKEFRAYKGNAPFERDVWLPDLQIMAARERGGTDAGLYLAVKGGNNGECHNHNDVGSCILFADGCPGLIDVGVGTYTRTTFSDDRYSIWTMQSAYHNLPWINGCMQEAGSEYRAHQVSYREAKEEASICMDIGKAYPTQAGIREYSRSYTLFRGSDARVEIRDRYLFEGGRNRLQFCFMCWNRPEVQRDGLLHIRLKNGKNLELRYPKEYSVKIEHKDTPDEKLHLVWGEEGVHRIILTPEEAGESGTAEFVIRKSEE